MNNMEIYSAVCAVPKNAQKPISAGRLKGMTDINPMWRIRSLTEQFGPCGIGWKYEILREWIETSPDTKEAAAFMDINLYYKYNGEWSAAIPGTGGSTFIAKESNGLHMSDECFKSALTDAISVACKALGFGADVYWAAGRSKYSSTPNDAQNDSGRPLSMPLCECCGKPIRSGKNADGEVWSAQDIGRFTRGKYGKPLCIACAQKAEADNADK